MRIVDPLLAITLLGVRRDGGRRVVRLDNEYARLETEPTFDQIVVERGTLPNARRPASGNPRQRQRVYQLFRIGDAVASRNIHAATYDALRQCSAL